MSEGIGINLHTSYSNGAGSSGSKESLYESLYSYRCTNCDNNAIRNGFKYGHNSSSPRKINKSNLHTIISKKNLSNLHRYHSTSDNVETILNLPPHLISLIISHITSQSDLINLKLANSSFDSLVNEKLYKNIQISDIDINRAENLNLIHSYKTKINNNITFLPITKLVLFLKTIVNNSSIADQFIQTIHFKVDSLSLDYYRDQFKTLIQLFSSTNIPIIIHNYATLKYFNECNDFLDSNGLRNGELYENDGTPSDSYSFKSRSTSTSVGNLHSSFSNKTFSPQKLTKLVRYSQLCTIQDFDDVKNSTTHLALYRNSSSFRFYDSGFRQINETHSIPLFVNKLIHLHLNTPNITNKFFQLLDSAFLKYGSVLQKMNLESLSIHSGHSQFQKHLITFNNLSRFINFLSLKNLEIKYRCDTNDYCLLEFMNEWTTHNFDVLYDNYTYFKNQKNVIVGTEKKSCSTNNNFRFIEKFSLMFTEENNKINEQYCIFVENFLTRFENLKYLYISLNDFHSPAYNRFINVNINYDSYTPLFIKLQQLKNLQILIIPDFFYISNVYLGENFSNFLNNCNCSECHKSRRLFFEVAKMFSILSNKAQKQHEVQKIVESFRENDFFMLHDHFDVEYFFTFFTIIHSLRQRLGTGINNLASNLNLLQTFPNNVELHDDISILGDSVDLILQLILHCLLDTLSLKNFLLNSPSLKLMILGGIYFKVSRKKIYRNGIPKEEVKIESLFSQFTKTYI